MGQVEYGTVLSYLLEYFPMEYISDSTGVSRAVSSLRREAVTVDLKGFVVNDSGIKGIRNAMAPLMRLKADLEDGKVRRDQIPDFVFDIKEYESTREFPANGEVGKIYVDDAENRIFRWDDKKRKYVELASPEAQGYYKLPEGGIPESDMAEAVRILLGKADTALQEHQLLREIFSGEGPNAKLKEYILGDQTDKPIVPSKILSQSENPTVGEVANALGWERREQQS